MEINPTDSYRHQLKKSGSTSRIENLSTSISDSTTDLGLPQELITEILLRLPVKPLLKFKCISKSWLSLISSPRFIMSHFSISSREGQYLNHQLLFTTQSTNYSPHAIKQCSLYSALREADPSTHVFDIEYPSECKNHDHPPKIVGMINGLVCLAFDGTDLFLWNPVLRKSKHLPDSNVTVNVKPPLSSVSYGFGYDESNDDYKVVIFLTMDGSEGVEVKVYSRQADSWKRIEYLKGFHPMFHPGIYVNGKIYLWGYEPGGWTTQGKRKIVRLDMVSDMYGEVQLPDCEPTIYDWRLGVLGGERPFVLCDYYNYFNRKVDLWVMDHTYEVQESWYKLFSIPYPDFYPQSSFSYQRAFCILINDEIVLASRLGYVVYNSKHKESRGIELGCSSLYEAGSYVESLVSPN